MMEPSKGKKMCILFYSFICWMISSSGLAWQVASLSIDFFKYETFSQLFINRPETIRPPALDMCSSLQSYSNPNYTIADFLTQQSPADEVISHINYRNPPNYTYDYHNYPAGKIEMDPMGVIKIQKFLKNKFTCYSFKLQPGFMTDFDYRQLVTDFPRPLIYVLFINPWSTAGRLKGSFWYIFMHPWEESFYQAENNFYELYWPDMSQMTQLSSDIGGINRLVALTYQLYQTYLLPPPYVTDCYNYSSIESTFESQAQCYETCYNKTIFDKFGLVSSSIPTFEPSNQHRFTEWKPEYRKYEEECRKRCRMKDCRYNDFIPSILSTGDSNYPEFRLHATNHPVVRQTAVAKINMTEYVTFVLSCVSFWFGFSPLDFLLQGKSIIYMRKRGRDEINLISYY